MELKSLRKQHGLTQKEVASILGVPYRTYIRYEENAQYQKTYKYKKFYDDLSKYLLVDEEHGILSLRDIVKAVVPLLINKNIKFCYLFGSYARNQAKENSDVDLLIDTSLTGFDFLSLVEELRNALHKKVDLLRLQDITPDNPISLEILKEGIRLI